jgi:hypothetical protein
MHHFLDSFFLQWLLSFSFHSPFNYTTFFLELQSSIIFQDSSLLFSFMLQYSQFLQTSKFLLFYIWALTTWRIIVLLYFFPNWKSDVDHIFYVGIRLFSLKIFGFPPSIFPIERINASGLEGGWIGLQNKLNQFLLNSAQTLEPLGFSVEPPGKCT